MGPLLIFGESHRAPPQPPRSMLSHRELYDAIGGRPTLERVHKRFYDDLYADPWLGGFFVDIDQDLIESQQTDFMSGVMGGPKCFAGQSPRQAHRHMFITDDMLTYRSRILERAIRAEGVSEEACAAWLDLDASFRGAIAKRSIDECEERYSFEGIVSVNGPVQGGLPEAG